MKSAGFLISPIFSRHFRSVALLIAVQTCLSAKSIMKNAATPIKWSCTWLTPEPANNAIMVNKTAKNKVSAHSMLLEKTHFRLLSKSKADRINGNITPIM